MISIHNTGLKFTTWSEKANRPESDMHKFIFNKTKSPGFILCGPYKILWSIHLVLAEIFQSWPKWWTNRPIATLCSIQVLACLCLKISPWKRSGRPALPSRTEVLTPPHMSRIMFCSKSSNHVTEWYISITSPVQNVTTQECEAHSFAHFDHPLLQVNVLFEAGMRSSSPENFISERKLQIILLHNTDNNRYATNNKCIPQQTDMDSCWWVNKPGTL